MADSLEPLLSVEDLFDGQGSVGSEGSVPTWLPHHQGDVFSGVEMPGVDSTDDNYAMLFMHPCTMRAGAALRPAVTVIRVLRHPSRRLLDRAQDWQANYKVMPLPDMLGNGSETYFADFMSLGTVASEVLDRSRRVARLSLSGRTQFQQRIIYHITRLAPSTDRLEEVTSDVEDELSLQEEWVARAISGLESPSNEDLSIAEASFEEYLSSPTDSIKPIEISDDTLLATSPRRKLLGSRYKRRVMAEVRKRIATLS